MACDKLRRGTAMERSSRHRTAHQTMDSSSAQSAPVRKSRSARVALIGSPLLPSCRGIQSRGFQLERAAVSRAEETEPLRSIVVQRRTHSRQAHSSLLPLLLRCPICSEDLRSSHSPLQAGKLLVESPCCMEAIFVVVVVGQIGWLRRLK